MCLSAFNHELSSIQVRILLNMNSVETTAQLSLWKTRERKREQKMAARGRHFLRKKLITEFILTSFIKSLRLFEFQEISSFALFLWGSN